MQGLMPEPQTPDMSGPMPTAPDAASGNATPEEQAIYKRFVGNGLTIAFSDKVMGNIIATMKSGDPIQGLAEASATVVMLTAKSASQKGMEISPEILMQGGAEIFEALAELATKAGIHDFSDDKSFKSAWLLAVDEARMMLQQEGVIDQKASQQDLQEFEQMGMEG